MHDIFMHKEDIIEKVRRKFVRLSGVLDERGRRVWAAVEAEALGYGGQSIVAKATGLSRVTLHREGVEKGEDTLSSHPDRIRKAGGGRKKLTQQGPELLSALEALVEPTTRGIRKAPFAGLVGVLANWQPPWQRRVIESVTKRWPLCWMTWVIAFREIKKPKKALLIRIGTPSSGIFMDGLMIFSAGDSRLCVDTKKKELVGDFKNGGQEWHPKGNPERVRVYDFVDKVLGKANPYGVYDPTANVGWVSVGVDHDTAEFAVETLRRWWEKMGRSRYPAATELLVTADGGGSNGARVRLWKVALQRPADQTGLRTRYAISRQEPASGTRLSIGCSVISA